MHKEVSRGKLNSETLEKGFFEARMAGREAFEALLAALTTKNSTVVQASGWIKAQTERSELEFAGDALCKVRHPSAIVPTLLPNTMTERCCVPTMVPPRAHSRFSSRRSYAPTSVPSSRLPPFLSAIIVPRVSRKYSYCVFRQNIPTHFPTPPRTHHSTLPVAN